MDSRTQVIAAARAAEDAQPTPLVVTTARRVMELQSIYTDLPGVRMDIQCARLMAAMKLDFVTLREARDWLDVTHPSECVRLLRKNGIEVVSKSVWQVNGTQVLHKTAAYSLPDA